MPIYEYRCRRCKHCFEVLVLPPATSKPACPSCQGKSLEQLLSAFGVNSAERSQTTLRAARKENEKSLRDQRIAQHEEYHHHH